MEHVTHRFDFPVADVIVGDRGRKDIGSLDELMASIKSYGLFHPITVNAEDNNTLIIGERRLRAHKQLGRETIRAYVVSGVTEADIRAMELDENIVRRQLHWSEEANMTALVIKAQGCTQQEYARFSGISQPTISRHVNTAAALAIVPN